jgi:hypothetical protein
VSREQGDDWGYRDDSLSCPALSRSRGSDDRIGIDRDRVGQPNLCHFVVHFGGHDRAE